MKSTSTKEQFVILRAEGLSFSRISEKLGISKSTCTKWERELTDRIRAAKEDRLTDLYTLYRIGKEAHITKLGETLKRIDEAIDEADLKRIPAEKLLKLKLEYEERIQALRTDTTEGTETFKDCTTQELLDAVVSLYERLRSGTVTAQQAKAELNALGEVKKAISANEWML